MTDATQRSTLEAGEGPVAGDEPGASSDLYSLAEQKDHHSALMAIHPGLLKIVGDGMKAFHDAIVAVGVQNQMTFFTASDFGRTLSTNGDGSDHGWGSHQFVMGGAVRGKRWFGGVPAVTVDSQHAGHVGQGRLI